jgi:hypothetical protein
MSSSTVRFQTETEFTAFTQLETQAGTVTSTTTTTETLLYTLGRHVRVNIPLYLSFFALRAFVVNLQPYFVLLSATILLQVAQCYCNWESCLASS